MQRLGGSRSLQLAEYRYFLRGEVDLAVAPEIREELQRAIEQDGAHLLVDCTHLTFIDSTGIGVLLDVNAVLEQEGRHMLLVNVPRGPRRVLETLGLTDLTRYDRDELPQ